jgi:uncharacterized protein (UPF0276 family)
MPVDDSGCVGIGLRQPHYRALLDGRPTTVTGDALGLGSSEAKASALGFVEVHSENFFADGGAALAVLHEARSRYPISLHGVGLSLGSAIGLDDWHLDQLARLVERIEPVRVSDHASFARAMRRGESISHLNDLLPIAFTTASLDIMAANVSQVQDRLHRPILVENLSAYFRWADDALPEPEFFNALARRTGCGVLLDVNNLVVNALNAGTDPVTSACVWIDALAPGIAGEIHLAGYKDLGDIVIDDHGSRVHEPVWRVYEHALARLGPLPTLIEWDTELPTLEVLLGEASQAARLQRQVCQIGRVPETA